MKLGMGPMGGHHPQPGPVMPFGENPVLLVPRQQQRQMPQMVPMIGSPVQVLNQDQQFQQMRSENQWLSSAAWDLVESRVKSLSPGSVARNLWQWQLLPTKAAEQIHLLTSIQSQIRQILTIISDLVKNKIQTDKKIDNWRYCLTHCDGLISAKKSLVESVCQACKGLRLFGEESIPLASLPDPRQKHERKFELNIKDLEKVLLDGGFGKQYLEKGILALDIRSLRTAEGNPVHPFLNPMGSDREFVSLCHVDIIPAINSRSEYQNLPQDIKRLQIRKADLMGVFTRSKDPMTADDVLQFVKMALNRLLDYAARNEDCFDVIIGSDQTQPSQVVVKVQTIQVWVAQLSHDLKPEKPDPETKKKRPPNRSDTDSNRKVKSRRQTWTFDNELFSQSFATYKANFANCTFPMNWTVVQWLTWLTTTCHDGLCAMIDRRVEQSVSSFLLTKRISATGALPAQACQMDRHICHDYLCCCDAINLLRSNRLNWSCRIAGRRKVFVPFQILSLFVEMFDCIWSPPKVLPNLVLPANKTFCQGPDESGHSHSCSTAQHGQNHPDRWSWARKKSTSPPMTFFLDLAVSSQLDVVHLPCVRTNGILSKMLKQMPEDMLVA